ncbi:hypothetical protein D3C85_1136990 [compost metagenome]
MLGCQLIWGAEVVAAETGAVQPGHDLFQGRTEYTGSREHIAHVQRLLTMRADVRLTQDAAENLLHIHRR